MFWSFVIFLAAFVFAMQYFIEYRDWLDLNQKDVYKTAPGPCKVVKEDGGSEDVVYIGNNKILISEGFNMLQSTGSLMTLDLSNNKVTTLNLTNIPSRSDLMAAPHGMTTWRDPVTDELFVYVITHPGKEDRIEVFEVLPSLILRYVKTITDPNFTYMNDLVAVGKDKFYIAKFWHFRERAWFYLETMVRWPSGGVMYYDGHRAREIASGFFMPDGIDISPDKSMVYVAEFGYKTLHGFRREASNNIVKAWEVNMGTGIDNINVDPDTGDLWIGCHQRLYKVLDFYGLFGYTNPSQVLRVKIRDQAVSEVEVIYSDDGREIAASNAATYANGKLIVGSMLSQTVVCDVNYLSS